MVGLVFQTAVGCTGSPDLIIQTREAKRASYVPSHDWKGCFHPASLLS